MFNRSPSSPSERFKRRTLGMAPAPRQLPRRGRKPLFAGQKPRPAEGARTPWYVRLLDPRLYLRAAITLSALAAVTMMFVLGRQHLMQQWQARPEPTTGMVRPGALAGEALSLDNLEDTLLGLYLRVQQPALARAAGEGTQKVPFTIEEGETATQVAERLQQMGIISDASLFRLYMRYNRIDQQLEAGDFELSYTMNMTQIAQALQNALVREVTVTVPEGWRAEQVGDLLQEQGIMSFDAFMTAVRAGNPVALGMGSYDFLEDRPAGASFEGYLFPDTYRIPARGNPTDLLTAMLNNFGEKLPTDLRASTAASGFSFAQIVTLASIVEREAVQADERPLIASVYRNRLSGFCDADVGGPYLQADPTVQYARGQPGNWWWKPESIEEYQFVQSPYNTYLNPGLPPGPIASPGLSSLAAAVRPAETQYCFFVATGQDGRHVFARTYAEHQANVLLYGGQ